MGGKLFVPECASRFEEAVGKRMHSLISGPDNGERGKVILIALTHSPLFFVCSMADECTFVTLSFLQSHEKGSKVPRTAEWPVIKERKC